ncbi:hypothetical protein CDIK_3961 [Cucumispora dikerogammari]|nr:hypothetical protein CDIK_3961 [Cucumispora dikerogammari]
MQYYIITHLNKTYNIPSTTTPAQLKNLLNLETNINIKINNKLFSKDTINEIITLNKETTLNLIIENSGLGFSNIINFLFSNNNLLFVVYDKFSKMNLFNPLINGNTVNIENNKKICNWNKPIFNILFIDLNIICFLSPNIEFYFIEKENIFFTLNIQIYDFQDISEYYNSDSNYNSNYNINNNSNNNSNYNSNYNINNSNIVDNFFERMFISNEEFIYTINDINNINNSEDIHHQTLTQPTHTNNNKVISNNSNNNKVTKYNNINNKVTKYNNINNKVTKYNNINNNKVTKYNNINKKYLIKQQINNKIIFSLLTIKITENKLLIRNRNIDPNKINIEIDSLIDFNFIYNKFLTIEDKHLTIYNLNSGNNSISGNNENKLINENSENNSINENKLINEKIIKKFQIKNGFRTKKGFLISNQKTISLLNLNNENNLINENNENNEICKVDLQLNINNKKIIKFRKIIEKNNQLFVLAENSIFLIDKDFCIKNLVTETERISFFVVFDECFIIYSIGSVVYTFFVE